MPIDTSLQPIPASEFSYAHAKHLLLRAGFGGEPAQIARLHALGLDRAVDHLVDYEAVPRPDDQPEYDPDLMDHLSPERRRARYRMRRELSEEQRDLLRMQYLQRKAEDRVQMGRLARWWLGRMIATARPLEEKLSLLWHGHFASNFRTVQDSYMMLQQNAMFRNEAKRFPALARGIVRDPAMLKFLNNDRNIRRSPNENLARELMELFTLGEGRYTERDIKEGARALTGYGIDDHHFRFYESRHDPGEKMILGRSGPFDGDDFVDILLRRRDCAEFICFKLYRHFVADVGEEPPEYARAAIERMADRFAADKGELDGVLKTLFKSRHFYDPQILGNKIKSPAELVVGSARSLGAPVRSLEVLHEAMARMGQRLFDPPSVAGWDVGRSWVNTSTLFVRQNVTVYQLTGKLPYEDRWSRESIGFDATQLLAALPGSAGSERAAEYLLTALLAGEKGHDVTRRTLRDFLRENDGPPTHDRLVATMLLITAAPEYQLC